MEYEELLQKTVVPESLPHSEQIKRIKPLREYLLKRMPTTLFRYRECSELNIQAFLDDQIWASKPKFMNDDFDSRLFFSERKVRENLESEFDADKHLKMLNAFRQNKEPLSQLLKLFPSAQKGLSQLGSLSDKEVESFLEEMKTYLKHELHSFTETAPELQQNTIHIACFSENIASSLMWGHYSNNATGFALGYDFKSREEMYISKAEIGNYSAIISLLYAVEYSNKKYDTSDLVSYLWRVKRMTEFLTTKNLKGFLQFVPALCPCPDVLLSTKAVIHKSLEWEPEKEWRMINTTDDLVLREKDHIPIKRGADSLYLGRNISRVYRRLLLDIAKEKNIPVYEMRIDDTVGEYKLKPVRVA